MAKEIVTDSNNNPVNNGVKETVCYGRKLDEFFVEQNKINSDTKQYGLLLP
jgi:hypothetical protein